MFHLIKLSVFLLLSWPFTPILAQSAHKGEIRNGSTRDSGSIKGEIRNGGDTLVIGGAIRTFDEVEYSDPFFPEDLGSVWSELDARLGNLAKHLPLTGRYLRQMFERGRITWTFVDVKLRPIPDEGPSSLIVISRNKDQIAANHGNLVQIHRGIWNELSDLSKAYVLMHEALWLANNNTAFHNGSQVRAIVGVLFDKNLNRYLTQNLINTLMSIYENSNLGQNWLADAQTSKMYLLMTLDRHHLNTPPAFDSYEAQQGVRSDIVMKATKGSIAGLEVTPSNMSNLIQSLSIDQDGLLTLASGHASSSVGLSEICPNIAYAGHHDWRLPTTKELWEMVNLGLLNMKYPIAVEKDATRSKHFALDGLVPVSQERNSDEETNSSKKQVTQNRIITSDGVIYNLADRLKDETSSYTGPLSVICIRDTKGAKE